MLLAEIAATSTEVGSLSSRLAKVNRVATTLAAAGASTDIGIVVAWLSGELPQRQIGVGWASLRSLPDPAATATLTVDGVDATFSAIKGLAGRGSQARRSERLAALFSAATDDEQEFLRRLLAGELRQGALAGVMVDAVAKAAGVPVATVRRAAMLAGDLPVVAAAALTDGESALARFTLQVGRPVGPMLAQTATGVGDALDKLGGTAMFESKLDGARVQIHRAGDTVTVYTRSLDDVSSLGVEARRLNLTTQKLLMRSGFPNLGRPPHMLCTRGLSEMWTRVHQSTALDGQTARRRRQTVVIG